MCVANAPAEFVGTRMYAGRVGPEHVLAYQNTARNRAEGPNAMLMHFPAVPGTMSERSVLPTDGCMRIFDDMTSALIPLTRGGPSGSVMMSAASVFDAGIYTVVLADDARAIPAALARVAARKRPSVNQPLYDWYAETFPGFPVALCCFDNREAAKAAPLMWRYRPRNEDVLFYPALDCHSGGVPDLDTEVLVEHELFAEGTDSEQIYYRDDIPLITSRYLPERVTADAFQGPMINGDFVRGGDGEFQRVTPSRLVSMVG